MNSGLADLIEPVIVIMVTIVVMVTMVTMTTRSTLVATDTQMGDPGRAPLTIRSS